MKLKLLLLTFILVCTGCKNDSRIQAAYDLIERVTPWIRETIQTGINGTNRRNGCIRDHVR